MARRRRKGGSGGGHIEGRSRGRDLALRFTSGSLLDAVTDLTATLEVDGTVTVDATDAASAPDGYRLYRQEVDADGNRIGSRVLLDTIAHGGWPYSDPFNVGGASSVTALQRDGGSAAGGATLPIEGTDFSGTPPVTIGGVAATNVVVQSPTLLTCTVPAYGGTPDPNGDVVDVTVGGHTLANAWTYYPERTTTFQSRVTSEDGTGGGLTESGSPGAGTVADSTEQAASGTHSRKCTFTSDLAGGIGAGRASIYYESSDNLMLTEPNGVYFRFRVYIPQATIDACLAAGGATSRQQKIHLLRKHVGSGQPGYTMIGHGAAFGGAGHLRFARDNGIVNLLDWDGGAGGIADRWIELQGWQTRKNSTGSIRWWGDGKRLFDYSSASMGDDISGAGDNTDDWKFDVGGSHHEAGTLTDMTCVIYVDEYELANGFIDP